MEEGQECEHLTRPTFPWRADRHTLCGLAADEVTSAISLDALVERIERDGHAQTSVAMCRTCWDGRETARWDSNPIGVVAREAVRAGIGSREPSHQPEAALFRAELRAIAALIEVHRAEFDGYLTGLAATTNLAEHRRRA